MDKSEQDILKSYLDDVKAERDSLKLQLKKASTPIFNFSLGLDRVWADLIKLTEDSDGWHFGLWILFATAFGTTAWAIIYSVYKFWELMSK